MRLMCPLAGNNARMVFRKSAMNLDLSLSTVSATIERRGFVYIYKEIQAAHYRNIWQK